MNSTVNRHDTAGKVAITHFFEPGVFHHLRQFLLGRMLSDAFSQVAVAGLIVGYQFSQDRERPEGPGVIDRLEGFGLNGGEFQNKRFASWPQYTVHLAQSCWLVGDIAQAEGDGHGVKFAAVEWQVLGVGNRVTDVAYDALVFEPPPAYIEHGFIDITKHDTAVGAHAFTQERRDITGSSGQVQNPVARADAAVGGEITFPETMNAQ